MRDRVRVIVLFLCGTFTSVSAAEKLVLDVNIDTDLLSLSHHIEHFPFTPTMNFAPDQAGNLSDRIKVDTLKQYLVITVLVRIDGEIAGFATEQETLRTDPDTGAVFAESAWLMTLNHPRAQGFLSVMQREDPAQTFGLVQKVMAHPEAEFADEEHRFLSTAGDTFVQLASGGLSPYQGGRFEEYNIVNPAVIKRDKRPRGRIIEFVIYPAD
jgi:hypothetical protein